METEAAPGKPHGGSTAPSVIETQKPEPQGGYQSLAEPLRSIISDPQIVFDKNFSDHDPLERSKHSNRRPWVPWISPVELFIAHEGERLPVTDSKRRHGVSDGPISHHFYKYGIHVPTPSEAQMTRRARERQSLLLSLQTNGNDGQLSTVEGIHTDASQTHATARATLAEQFPGIFNPGKRKMRHGRQRASRRAVDTLRGRYAAGGISDDLGAIFRELDRRNVTSLQIARETGLHPSEISRARRDAGMRRLLGGKVRRNRGPGQSPVYERVLKDINNLTIERYIREYSHLSRARRAKAFSCSRVTLERVERSLGLYNTRAIESK